MSNRKYEFVGCHPSLSIRRGFRRGKYDPAVSDSFYTSALDPETDVYKIKLKDNTVIPYLTNKKIINLISQILFLLCLKH